MLKAEVKVTEAISDVTKLLANEITSLIPRREAEWMLEKILGAKRAEIYSNRGLVLNPAQRELLYNFTGRRIAGEPLQHILGTVEFRNLTLKIDRRALIPRPETEGLVDLGLQIIGNINRPDVLDVGTGCGAIALSIADERPGARITAVDISREALNLAAENGRFTELYPRIRWIESDFYRDDFVNQFDYKFDLVISNPPYVSKREFGNLPPEIMFYEPEVALLAGDNGSAAIRRLAVSCDKLLTMKGHLLCEIGETQESSTISIFEKYGWDVTIKKDLSGKPRYVIASRNEAPARLI